MSDWTPDPTKTQPATDGSGRRREWAFRDVSPGAPIQPRQLPKTVPVMIEAQREVAWTESAETQSDAAVGRAKAAADKRFSRTIDSANADLDAGRWTWPAILLCLFLCGGTAWGVVVSVWPMETWTKHPQTQPSITPGTPGSGANHSRDLLIEWSRTVTWKRLRGEEQEAARKAVEADR